MSRIIAFAGKIGSGKDACAKFVTGVCATTFQVIDDFYIPDGELIIDGKNVDHNTLCPNVVKTYKFADELKNVCSKIFGIDIDKANSDPRYKNSVTEIKWENCPGVCTNKHVWNYINKSLARKQSNDYRFKDLSVNLIYHEPGYMTVREILQFFGSEVCRRMYSDCWVKATIKNIEKESSIFSLISDARFKSEFEYIRKNDGVLVKLERQIESSNHQSETDIDEWNDWDLVIDNRDGDLRNLYRNLMEGLYELNALYSPRYKEVLSK